MPEVSVKYKREDSFVESMVGTLSKELPGIVSRNLNSFLSEKDEGRVTEKDIIVDFEEHGKYDVNTKDLQIKIFLHDFPLRKKYKQKCNDAITEEIQKVLYANHTVELLNGFVWTWLLDTAFSKLK